MKRFLSAILLALGTGATFAQSTTQDTTKKTTTTTEVATTPSTSTTTTAPAKTSTEVSTSTTVSTDDKKQPETNDPKATHEKKKKKKRKLSNPNLHYLVFLQNKRMVQNLVMVGRNSGHFYEFKFCKPLQDLPCKND